MTVGTPVAGLSHGSKRAAMTAFASHVSVRTLQLKVGLDIVIEEIQVPGDRVMARLAVALENATMIVIFQVTVDADIARVSKSLSLMTVVTFNVCMLAQ